MKELIISMQGQITGIRLISELESIYPILCKAFKEETVERGVQAINGHTK